MPTLDNKELDFFCFCSVEILVLTHLVNDNLATKFSRLDSAVPEVKNKPIPWQPEYLFSFLFAILFSIPDGKRESIQKNVSYHPHPTLSYDDVLCLHFTFTQQIDLVYLLNSVFNNLYAVL